jgi:putative membrane protein
MAIAMIVFWALIITAVVLVVRYLVTERPTGTTTFGAPPRGPEDVLAERYARGDIDNDEYQRRLALLRRNRPVSPS